MILLLVPLAMGAVRSPRGELREGVRRVLAETDGEDSRLAYEAIRLAAPGGLGRAERHDLAGEAPPALSEAMAEAASRDSVAREYVSDFDLTFGLVLPSLIRGLDGGLSLSEATVRAFLETLAEVPDTLIARKVGAETAEEVSRFARVLSGGSASTLSGTGVERSSVPSGACPAFGGGGKQEPIFPGPRIDSEGLEIFDAKLRSRGNRLNPGTTADLVAAGLFALLAEEGEERILAAR
jgi:triphosphoribosyl-dephospho-CoA synthase